ncbi:MAG: cysteine desulfurase [Alphaproteobacteria bacterium]|nr:cysteine desulfurase [Alphaproteobacteria bacterium]
MPRIYLDYNATCPIRPEVIEIVRETMTNHGNASSIHADGRQARKIVEDARAAVAGMVGASAKQVIFTSGASESNNTILRGFEDYRILISAIEHPSVYFCGRNVEIIPVNSNGLINLEKLEDLLQKSDQPTLVSVMMANNETGVIQPVKEITKLAKGYNATVHTDAVQAAGRFEVDFKDLDVDFMSLSAHKMGGPQGVGALIMRQGLNPPKFMYGGGQERRQRAGTENVSGIAGFGVAADLAVKEIEDFKALKTLREKMESHMRSSSNRVTIYGIDAPRVSNTIACTVKDMDSAVFMMNLDLEGVSISTGAACSSGQVKPSRVLMAMGVPEELAKTGLRISMGWDTKEAEIDRFLEIWTKLIQRLD